MPELPEVETLRQQLVQSIVGQTVKQTELHRQDIVTSCRSNSKPTAVDLLTTQKILNIHRHGKQLIISGDISHTRIHLGMTGNLLLNPQPLPAHAHLIWQFNNTDTLVFSDPRRFGHIWLQADPNFPPALGPDALDIKPGELHRRLSATRRPIKAALLDQNLLAGLGNIYTDELLFTIRCPPLSPACTLTADQTRQLVRHMRRLLNRAINAGGSTLRDYRSVKGAVGNYQNQHRIYGKKGQNCPVCASHFQQIIVCGRTTTICPQCQRKNQKTKNRKVNVPMASRIR